MTKIDNSLSDEMAAVAFRCAAIEHMPISQLKPSSRNARTHDERQMTVLKASMREFGFMNPVLIDEHDEIIVGHGRVEAAKQIGIRKVPAIRIEGLSADQIRAYRIADNRIAELAGWDREILAIELQHLEAIEIEFSIETIGFTPVEFDTIMTDTQRAKEVAADVRALGADRALARLFHHRQLAGRRNRGGDGSGPFAARQQDHSGRCPAP